MSSHSKASGHYIQGSKGEPHYWDEAHTLACDRQQDWYVDPRSGQMVATRYQHLRRGQCCSSGCRHCPYEEGELG